MINKGLIDGPNCIIATAHPSKFANIIEPILNEKIEVPESLARMISAKHRHITISPSLTSLKGAIKEYLG